MKKRILLATIFALAALLILVLPASATKSAGVSGKMAYAGPPENLEMRSAGENCIIDVDLPYVFYDGELEGIASMHFRIVSHGTCPADPFQYEENLRASGTFVGSVDGKEGTFDLIFVGRGWPADIGEPAMWARITILSGTGELKSLHGSLDIGYIMGDGYDTFTGQLHFDP